MDTLSFLQMQNADKDTRRHFVEELSHILSKCKQECLIDVDNMKIRLSVVPDAKTQSR